MASQNWFDIAQTTAGVIAGLIAGIAADPIRQFLLRPKVSAHFEYDAHCIRETPAVFKSIYGDETKKATYARIKVENNSRFTAKSCRAYLQSIERKETDGEYEVLFADCLPLPWAYLHQTTLDIPQGVAFYYDVLLTAPGSKSFLPATEQLPMVYQTFCNSRALYRFTTLVCGDNIAPVKTVLCLDWNGDGLLSNTWKE